MPHLHVGYILKRFPRASETFIAQEILELERRGVEIDIFTLWPNDKPAPHRWIRELRAQASVCSKASLSESWDWLHARGRADLASASRVREAVQLAFDYPSEKGRRYLGEAVAVARAAEIAGVQHLHAHFANHPTFVTLLVHLITGIPFSFTAHAKDIYANTSPPELWRRQVAEAAFAVTVSENNRLYLEQQLGQELSPKILTLYNGVDLQMIRPASEPTARATPEILCTARLIEKKGVDLLLEAIAILRRRGIALHCTIIGDGPDEKHLQQKSAALALPGVVDFAGARSHEEVISLLGRSDLFVLPARIAADGDRDALPTVLLEAMAAGLPCISTAVGGIPEIVSHRATGLLVPSDKSWALAEAISELLRSPELRRKMGRAARVRAEKLFDRRTNAALLHSWFAESAHPTDRGLVTSRLVSRSTKV